MQGHFTQADVLAGWVRFGFIDLIPVVTQGPDAVGALLCVKEALIENGPRRLDALLDLKLRHHIHAPARGD